MRTDNKLGNVIKELTALLVLYCSSSMCAVRCLAARSYPASRKLHLGTDYCLDCPVGYECPSDGLDAPVACVPGNYSDGTKATNCKECPLGNHCISTSHPPVPCDNGERETEREREIERGNVIDIRYRDE